MIFLSEHKSYDITQKGDETLFEILKTKSVRVFRTERGQVISPFSLSVSEEKITLASHYYIGIDWLATGAPLYVAPKMNHKSQEKEIDYLRMLSEVYKAPIAAEYTQDLIKIYWKEPQITIEQQKDFLTPFLVIQFLQLLKRIVRKGLKKSYYKEGENLCSRIKGKIQIGKHLKQNVFKNKLTSHICQYQAF